MQKRARRLISTLMSTSEDISMISNALLKAAHSSRPKKDISVLVLRRPNQVTKCVCFSAVGHRCSCARTTTISIRLLVSFTFMVWWKAKLYSVLYQIIVELYVTMMFQGNGGRHLSTMRQERFRLNILSWARFQRVGGLTSIMMRQTLRIVL